ncbi:MAG: hypothetical protein FJW77_08150 [Actinobacteria bacterium]|nr:hypothetical protein [Actinomycetota bacterium]
MDLGAPGAPDDLATGWGAADLLEIETELCRIPTVTAVRVVTDEIGRPLELHVLAQPGRSAKQIVRDVQSVALTAFGLEVDRRIVSVVQLSSNGSGAHDHTATGTPTIRPRIVTTQVTTSGHRTSVQVTLADGDDDANGFAEGSGTSTARLRLFAAATLDALRQLEPAAECLDLDSVSTVRIGAHELAVVVVAQSDPPLEHLLSGTALVRSGTDDAVVRAVLDATNRRLPRLVGRPADD